MAHMSPSSSNETTTADDEAVPFLPNRDDSPPPYTTSTNGGTPSSQIDIDDGTERDKQLTRRLYTSHLLSTWNSRTFEFASLLFIARIWKDTLLPVSVFAIFRALSAIVFAGRIGQSVDQYNRLTVVRTSIGMLLFTCRVKESKKYAERPIVGQRVAVILWLLFLLPAGMLASEKFGPRALRMFGSLVFLIPLACVEKVYSITNLVAIERDWVSTIRLKGAANLLSAADGAIR